MKQLETDPPSLGKRTVLVTGGTGFLGMYCILQLAACGYTIRTTLRSISREKEVRQMLKEGGIKPGYSLTFFEAELTKETGWKEALTGCDYVLHVASPFFDSVSKEEENKWIVWACKSTIRILRLAGEVGVKRVVLTSSFAAIGYGAYSKKKIYTEADWTDLSHNKDINIQSKTLAEKAAWDFIAHQQNAPELTVINPTNMFGPVLGKDYSPSIDLIKSLMEGMTSRVPKIGFPIVDVRDVAKLHVSALQNPVAAGERIIATSGDFMTMHQIAVLLRENFKEFSHQIPSHKMPNWLVRLTSLFYPDIRSILPNLSVVRRVSNQKACHLFHWEPRPAEDTLLDTARSLVRLGLVKPRDVY